jgi:hypothetical protein
MRMSKGLETTINNAEFLSNKKFHKSIKAEMGKNLPKMLSRSLIKTPYDAIGELACNSYDEDATVVEIDIDQKKRTLTITDNGLGMNEEGLENFFRLGDSYKIQQPTSPKGRKRVGRFGIAKVLLENLSKYFSIETVHSGRKYIIDEGSSEYELIGYSIPATNKKSGTKIVVKDLNFDIGKNGIDIYKLYCRLQWDVPDCLDFDIYVNEKLVKRRSAVREYASVYRFSEKVGRKKDEVVNGCIYSYRPNSKGKDLEGIKLCVDGRAIGTESFINLLEIDRRMPGRVQGEINADFLRDSITLNRKRVKEDFRVKKVRDIVRKVLYSISLDYDQGRGRRDYYGNERLLPMIEAALDHAQDTLMQKLGVNYELKFAGAEKSGMVSRFSPEDNIIYINPNCKIFALEEKDSLRNKNRGDIYLRRAFLVAAAHALSIHSSKSSDSLSDFVASQAKQFLEKFRNIGEIVGKKMQGEIIVPIKQIYLNPYRLYDHYEISALTGRPANVIRLMHTSRALEGTQDHLFTREHLLKGFNPIEEYISCIEIVDKKYSRTGIQMGGTVRIHYENPRPTNLDMKLKELNLDGMDILDVGIVHPFHFIRKEKRQQMLDFAKRIGYNNGEI